MEKSFPFPLFHNRLKLLRFEGYQTEITEFSLRYLDYLGLSVLTNNVIMPIVMNSQSQSQGMIEGNPYPPPNGEGTYNNPPQVWYLIHIHNGSYQVFPNKV